MKKNILFLFILSFIKISEAQNTLIDGDSSNLESNSSFVHIDTIPGNIWQVGLPQKTFFDTAYSASYAIMTDTINPYPVNNFSTFTVKFTDTTLSGIPDAYIGFWHKYEMDSLKDGGYVEISLDSGLTWINVANAWTFGILTDPINFYNNSSDTIEGNIPAFTGTQSNWEYSAIKLQWMFAIMRPFEDNYKSIYYTGIVMFRFVFKSDGIQTSKAGWIIDDIAIRIYDIGGGIKEKSLLNFDVQVFPNPVNEQGIIQVIPENNEQSFVINIYNAIGGLVATSTINKNSHYQYVFDTNNLTAGVYFYSVRSKDGAFKSGRLLKK